MRKGIIALCLSLLMAWGCAHPQLTRRYNAKSFEPFPQGAENYVEVSAFTMDSPSEKRKSLMESLSGEGQAALINDFLEHTEDEGEFFILLVQMTRAGNEHLRKYCRRRMQQIQKQRTVLKDRLNYQRTLSLEEQMKYYSAWYYAAIHMAPGISGISTPEKIARYLGLSLSTVISALDFLVSIGLLTVDGGNYSVGTGQLHLGNDSNLITKHHTNWRIESIKALDKESSDDLHYSSIVTLSHSDIPRVRETLLRAIDQVRAIVRPSQNEQMICYNLDLFKLNKQ